MSNSLPPMTLREGLSIWANCEDISTAVPAYHLSPEELLRLCRPDGMKEAGEKEKEHLALCSRCLRQWLDLSEEQGFVADLAEEEGSDDWYTGGMLEAAAAEITSALALKSRCGLFQLTLYPDAKKQGEGMVTLEYVGSGGAEVEGKWVVVRDRHGHILLDGLVRAGRIASLSNAFAQVDLQAWTVQIRSGETDGDGV